MAASGGTVSTRCKFRRFRYVRSSRRPGEAAARAFPRRRSAARQTTVANPGGLAIPVVTDLAYDDSLASLITRARAEFGPVDVLVNKAGANRGNYLLVDEAVDVVRFLLHTGNNVKLAPEILLSTIAQPDDVLIRGVRRPWNASSPAHLWGSRASRTGRARG